MDSWIQVVPNLEYLFTPIGLENVFLPSYRHVVQEEPEHAGVTVSTLNTKLKQSHSMTLSSNNHGRGPRLTGTIASADGRRVNEPPEAGGLKLVQSLLDTLKFVVVDGLLEFLPDT